MTLTGTPLLVISAIAAVLGPVALVLWLRRPILASELRTLARLGLVAGCQLLAVLTLFLWVNNTYGFYTSWADLLGRAGGITAIQSNGLVERPGDGRVQVVLVAGSPGTNGAHQVLVWLPKQYDQASAATTRFPVVMVLPGQPSTPQAMFNNFDFVPAATTAIDDGVLKPFIAVFPPLMTNPPRDTECTNVPRGPQAETWLSTDVYRAIRHSFRVANEPWSSIGYSTGAFCAAKLLLHHPNQYAAAAGLGGYYQTLTDRTTGNLFGSRAVVKEHNSPLWLYEHTGLGSRRILVVTGRQDHESYSQTEKFLAASRGDPGVSSLVFQSGGHNYRNYRVLLPAVLRWLNKVRAIT